MLSAAGTAAMLTIRSVFVPLTGRVLTLMHVLLTMPTAHVTNRAARDALNATLPTSPRRVVTIKTGGLTSPQGSFANTHGRRTNNRRPDAIPTRSDALPHDVLTSSASALTLTPGTRSS